MPLWRSGPNNRTLPAILVTILPSKTTDMTHLCVPQNQALGGSADLFMASKYAALKGERIYSQCNHHIERRRRKPILNVFLLTLEYRHNFDPKTIHAILFSLLAYRKRPITICPFTRFPANHVITATEIGHACMPRIVDALTWSLGFFPWGAY